MTPWVLLRHDLPDGSWHYDWMLANPAVGGAGVGGTGGETTGLLTTFRVTQRPDDPGTVRFDAERIGEHRRDYLTYQGPLSGGRGQVRREGGGLCRIECDDAVFAVELIGLEVRWVGTREGFGGIRYRFERAGGRHG